MTWIQTKSGRAYVFGVGPEGPLSHVDDVIYPMSRLPRFLGHTDRTWSVAAHAVTGSVLAERAMNDRHLARAFLHHDDGEALVGDVPTPLKAMIRGFREIEARASADAWAAFGPRAPTPAFMALHHDAVKRLDRVMLHAEHAQLQGPEPRDWGSALDHADHWLVDRARALIAHAVYQGDSYGARARYAYIERLNDLEDA